MRRAALAAVLFFVASASFAAPPAAEKATVRFEPLGDQQSIPERYRLDAHTFASELEFQKDLPGCDVDVYHLRFPSPVETPYPENNTVHADYFRPHGDGPFPCVIVLDILAGDGAVSRMIATYLAQHHVAALYVQMAYYGPRRPKEGKVRLLSSDYEHSMAAVRQTVLDLRRATAWMAARPEIDAKRLGILGTSLGSFLGTLTAEMEPRLGRVAVLLGGGGLVDAYYDNPQAKEIRKFWEKLGGTKEKLTELLAPADPLTCAANLKDRKVLMLAAKHDEVVPPKMAEALWKATGEQKIVWFDCGHYTAVFYIVPALSYVVRHFNAD